MATSGKLVVGLLVMALLCAMLDIAAGCNCPGGRCCNRQLHQIMDVQYMFDLCDLDNNKVVTQAEATLALPATSANAIRLVFENFDFNGDGRITENELAPVTDRAFDFGEN
ncbi:uncharacterized protein LOC144864934 [Branchiostoma floridae x Branchiostoma japonicum]